MKFWIVVFLFLVACLGSVNDNEILDAVPSKYLSFDSIPLEHWDSNRTRNYPYNLVKSVYNSYLDLRFDYYVFKTDGQSFPFKKVIVTKDTLSFTLDFEEEAAFSRYDLKDSLTPVSTIGNQLIVIFKTLDMDKRLQIMFANILFSEIMSLDYVQPFHRGVAVNQFDRIGSSAERNKMSRFFDELDKRGTINVKEEFEAYPRDYDVYNLDEYKCFYKIRFKDSFTIECIFPEEYDILLW